eukprot:264475_1
MDACEPMVEGDLSSFDRRVYGRHVLKIDKYHNENIVSTELKDEHAKQTTATLTESAKIWRASHSSPIVAKSKYTVSPSVDKILFPVQPEQITLQIPKSLLCMKSKLSNQPPTSISRLKYHEIQSCSLIIMCTLDHFDFCEVAIVMHY